MTHPTHFAVTDRALLARPVPQENDGVWTFALHTRSWQIDGKWHFEITRVPMRCMVVEHEDTPDEELTRYGQYLRLRVYPRDVESLDDFERDLYGGRGYIVRHMMGWFSTEDEMYRRGHYLDTKGTGHARIASRSA
jgi:hypothetical protein